jgi:hypothetical protein
MLSLTEAPKAVGVCVSRISPRTRSFLCSLEWLTACNRGTIPPRYLLLWQQTESDYLQASMIRCTSKGFMTLDQGLCTVLARSKADHTVSLGSTTL